MLQNLKAGHRSYGSFDMSGNSAEILQLSSRLNERRCSMSEVSVDTSISLVAETEMSSE